MDLAIDHYGGALALHSVQALAAQSDGASAPRNTPDVRQAVHDWIKSYLSSPHRELGRAGMVCPFTAHAARIDTIRVGVSDKSTADASAIEAEIRQAFHAFERIPCAKSMRHFRTVIIAFPNLGDADGIACLHAMQARTKVLTMVRGLMTGVFYATNDAPGLWNPDFRPLRSPIPLFAIRMLVEQDTPFIMRHPIMLATYLWRFPVAGAKRIVGHLAKSK